MSTVRCTVARSQAQIADAQRVRWRVYGEEEGLLPPAAGCGGREVDARDEHDDTIHLLVYAGCEPVGTVRLLQMRRGGAGAAGLLGLALEDKFGLESFAAPGIVAAEVTRFCILRQHRCTRAASALYRALHSESRQRGITHWVAGANMETDFTEDAALAYTVARARNLIHGRFRAERRAVLPARTPRRRACYTDGQRRRGLGGALDGLALPRTLALFAGRMGARFIGPPAYDDYFNVFALPLVAELGAPP
jgi:L-ornithine Nalpha-acyltransferase